MFTSLQAKDSRLTNRAARRRVNHALQLRPKLISIGAGCDYSGPGRSKFYDDVIPEIRTVKIGNRRLVDLDSLDEFLDRLVAEGPDEKLCDQEIGPITTGRTQGRRERNAPAEAVEDGRSSSSAGG